MVTDLQDSNPVGWKSIVLRVGSTLLPLAAIGFASGCGGEELAEEIDTGEAQQSATSARAPISDSVVHPPPGLVGQNPGRGAARPPGPGNEISPGRLYPPAIIGISQSRTQVNPGQTVTFRVVAADPEEQALTYTWSASEGNLSEPTSPAGDEVVWSAPYINSLVKVTARIRNGDGVSTTHTFNVDAHADLSAAVFVGPGGSDSNPGSPTAPYATVKQAINAAAAASGGGVTNVVIGAGIYNEVIELPSGISLWGQYNPITWQHEPAKATTLASPTSVGVMVSGHGPPRRNSAMAQLPPNGRVINADPDGTIQGLTITSSDATPGSSSVAVLLNNVSGTFNIQNNILIAGAGGNGVGGANGLSGVYGGTGGAPYAPGNSGGWGSNGAAGGYGGSAGAGLGAWGYNGGPGTRGADGTVPLNQAVGQILAFDWRALGGTRGWGGGGGGGGGGGTHGICCPAWLLCFPRSAGGGGLGGRGGEGGIGGSGAGGSFGIMILASTGSVVAENNQFYTSGGGIGGRGGNGGESTSSTSGAPGEFCWAGSGGNGGDGGPGGRGGGGAGGGGGMSVGILQHASPGLIDVGNVYYLGPSGAGGTGGLPGVHSGEPGIRANTFVIP